MSETESETKQPKPSKSKKRVRRPEEWKKTQAKTNRNLGKEYVSLTSGKHVAARTIGPPCRDKCFDKLTRPVIETIFKDFWDIGDYGLQNTYIQNLVDTVPVKRRRKPKEGAKPGPVRAVNLHYTVAHDNTHYQVCRQGFLSILGIKKDRVISALKKRSDSGTPQEDKRGKAPPAGTIRGTLAAQRVHEHIKSLPTVSSQHTKAKSPHRTYLDPSLSVTKLYRMYLDWMGLEHPDEETVKVSYYRNVFNNSYNISFQPPKTDTCSSCDELKIAIRVGQVDLQLNSENQQGGTGDDSWELVG